MAESLQANSGHPGLPMGCAPMSYVLWKDFMNVDPSSPKWENRDRFVLSAGHGSMLQYALLHLMGFNLSVSKDGWAAGRPLHEAVARWRFSMAEMGVEQLARFNRSDAEGQQLLATY